MSDNITFESTLEKLEKIVRELESGNVTLEESLKLFEKGITLSGICSNKLKEAKQKVEILMDSENGMVVSEFNINE